MTQGILARGEAGTAEDGRGREAGRDDNGQNMQDDVGTGKYLTNVRGAKTISDFDKTQQVAYEEAAHDEKGRDDVNTAKVLTRGEGAKTISYFDQIQQVAYEKAIAAPTPPQKRKPFSLDGWKGGTGGLDDADRRTLGDLYLKAESVFEFGLGESTLIAARVGVPRYAGVDSDATWVSNIKVEAKMEHFRFYFSDVGQTKLWGFPTNTGLSKIAYDYEIAPLTMELEPFDVYLVDGRYRIACTCASFLHAMKYGADMAKVRVGVHDNDQKRGYEVLKGIADLVVQNSKLWVYKLRETTTQEDLHRMWMHHFQNPI